MKARRIREFPRIAVMENRVLTAENEMDCFLNSPTQTGEQSDASNVCRCVPLPVIFVVAINLLSFPLLCGFSNSRSVKPSFFNSNYGE